MLLMLLIFTDINGYRSLIGEKNFLFCLKLIFITLKHLACLDYFTPEQNKCVQHCLKIMMDENQQNDLQVDGVYDVLCRKESVI